MSKTTSLLAQLYDPVVCRYIGNRRHTFFQLSKTITMSGEMEAPNVYEDLTLEERQTTVTGKKSQNKWVMPVAVVAATLLGALCFGAGFAVAYFAIPRAGRCR